MAYVRRKKKSTATTATKSTTGKKRASTSYEIDGVKYRSKMLMEYHQALSGCKYVKSFNLPTLGNEQEARVKRFGAFKVTVNDILFDSIMESRYYVHLLILQGENKIKSFERQVTIELQPKFKDKFTGKTILPIRYIADFVIVDNDDVQWIVDVKGLETPEFKLKKKMLQYKYPDTKFVCVQWVASQQKWMDLEDIKKERRSKK